MIKEINHNPYRVLGLYADASTKEQKSIIGKMRAYLSVDKEIGFNGEFSFLDKIDRNESLINASESKLALDKDKLLYSLFWFVDCSPVEEMALDYLSDGEDDKAISIWQKATKSSIPSKSTFGAYNNYSSYLVANYLDPKNFDKFQLKKALGLKSDLMHSSYFDNYIEIVCTQAAISLKEVIITEYFNIIISILESDIKLESSDIIELLSLCDFAIVRSIKAKQINNLKIKIERKIKAIETSTDSDLQAFLNLDEEVSALLTLLNIEIGERDFEYQHLSDEVADKQIARANLYFKNRTQGQESEFAKTALKYINVAEKHIIKSNTRSRFVKNKEALDSWIFNYTIIDGSSEEVVQVTLSALDIILDNLLIEDDITFDYVEKNNAGAILLLNRLNKALGPKNETVVDRGSCYSNCVNNIVVEYANTQIKSFEYSCFSLAMHNVSNSFSRILTILNSISGIEKNVTARVRHRKNVDDITKFKTTIDNALGLGSTKKSRGIFGTLKKMFFE